MALTCGKLVGCCISGISYLGLIACLLMSMLLVTGAEDGWQTLHSCTYICVWLWRESDCDARSCLSFHLLVVECSSWWTAVSGLTDPIGLTLSVGCYKGHVLQQSFQVSLEISGVIPWKLQNGHWRGCVWMNFVITTVSICISQICQNFYIALCYQ